MTDQLSGLDAALFRTDAVAPETAEANQNLRARLENMPKWWEQDGAGAAGARLPGPPRPPSERARTVHITGQGGHELALRIIAPDHPKGAYLHFHAGGFVSGGAAQTDQMLERTAREARLACISVDYRLAPARPYPAAWDDGESAALWLVENAQSMFGTDAIAIGGESAGANLAASVLVRMRDRHGFTGFAAANLVYGNFDLSMTPSQTLIGADAVPIPTAAIQACTDAVAPRPEQRRDPDLSPLYADLRELPAALFTVGTLDPFLDDSLFMYVRWIAAASPAELAVYPGGMHGFVSQPSTLASQANDRLNAFLRRVALGVNGSQV